MRQLLLAVTAILLSAAAVAEPPAMADRQAIETLASSLAEAWNRGDATAFAARFEPDGTFTNVNGSFYVGHDAFEARHRDIFRGIFNGVSLTLTIKNLRFVRPDVAIADMDAALSGLHRLPSGVQAGSDGLVHTSLELLLVNRSGEWWIASMHNAWVAAGN